MSDATIAPPHQRGIVVERAADAVVLCPCFHLRLTCLHCEGEGVLRQDARVRLLRLDVIYTTVLWDGDKVPDVVNETRLKVVGAVDALADLA